MYQNGQNNILEPESDKRRTSIERSKSFMKTANGTSWPLVDFLVPTNSPPSLQTDRI